jgi:hypothetical protein
MAEKAIKLKAGAPLQQNALFLPGGLPAHKEKLTASSLPAPRRARNYIFKNGLIAKGGCVRARAANAYKNTESWLCHYQY